MSEFDPGFQHKLAANGSQLEASPSYKRSMNGVV